MWLGVRRTLRLAHVEKTHALSTGLTSLVMMSGLVIMAGWRLGLSDGPTEWDSVNGRKPASAP